MTTPADVIAAARALVGVPFLHQGRSAGGVDCLGLLRVSTDRVGLDVFKLRNFPDVLDYGRNANPRLLELLRAHGADLEIAAPVPACAVLFRFRRIPHPQHLAIYTERDTIIHADARLRRVVECSYRAAWRRFTHSYWKFPGVDYGP